MNQIKHNEGFLIVASCHAFYKNSALVLIDTLEEYYPDCKIMVSTLPEWEDEFRVFDSVVEVRTDGPDERRSKLWALQHTVFKKTCYLDADMEILSDEIQTVWGLLDEDHDCAFTCISPEHGQTTAIYKVDGEAEIRDNDVEKHLRYHGGFFLWWHDEDHPNAVEAMRLWWIQWLLINRTTQWWDDHPEIFSVNKSWDQFTWWWIMRYLTPELKVQEVEGGSGPKMYRWNYHHIYKHSPNYSPDVPAIILHKIINRDMMNDPANIKLTTGKNSGGG